MFKVKSWLTAKPLLLASLCSFTSVNVTLKKADEISERFDVNFGINNAFAGVEFVGSICTPYTITSTSVDSCGSSVTSVFEGSYCEPQYEYIDDPNPNLGSDSSSSNASFIFVKPKPKPKS